MQIYLTSRHFRAPKSLRESITKKVAKLERFYEGIVSCDIILTEYNSSRSSKKVEIVLRVYRSTLTSVVRSDEFSTAVAESIEKVERQLKKYKSKRRERHKTRKRQAALAA